MKDKLGLSVSTLLATIRARLGPESETASLEAQVLLAHVLGAPRAWVLAHPEARLSSEQTSLLEAYLQRLEGGEPLPYVLGHWEFFGLDFTVTPDVLIPRPETELLVEQALGWLRLHASRRLAADVGTGSGCIAVALAAHIPDLHILASDLSPAALQVASHNAARHAAGDRITFIQTDLLLTNWPTGSTANRTHLANQFDLICANLPYIPTETLAALRVARWEPRIALDGGRDGLDLLRRLVAGAPDQLAPGGLLLLEIEARQGAAAAALARQAFPQAEVQVLPDLSGLDRVIRVQSALREEIGP